MRNTTIIVLACAALAASQMEAQARASFFNQPAVPLQTNAFLPINGETRPPIGWLQFCQGQPEECQRESRPPRDAVMTKARWAELDQVNRRVNTEIEPITDWEHYGVINYWGYPEDGKGNCDKYTMEKRRRLRERGWPESALLVTVVLDHHGEGHAVLMVRTNEGDFILDNMVDEIMPWHETGYRYIKRQSQWNPNIWVALPSDMGRITPATTSSR